MLTTFIIPTKKKKKRIFSLTAADVYIYHGYNTQMSFIAGQQYKVQMGRARGKEGKGMRICFGLCQH